MQSSALLRNGLPWPLGATLCEQGINFAVFSAHASRIELCVFSDDGAQEIARYTLPGRTGDIWHGLLPSATSGLVYGYRAHGPYHPEAGHRFNPQKLLLDPYTREIVGNFHWRREHFGYETEHADSHHSFSHSDNGPWALKARVPLIQLDKARPARPIIPSRQVVLYELHVKGFTQTHPDVPAALRGTYAGLACPAVIDYLRALGVTSLSLMPVHFGISEQALVQRGLSNYWNYNPLAFFAVEPRYWSRTTASPAAEFRAMVDTLHQAGFEVIVDMVFNHTAEGPEAGPTLSFRGLDNASYYRLPPENRAYYENITGCGNTLNVAHGRVTQLVLDALRYWVSELGVDGFRFDLAPVLGRGRSGFDPHTALFVAMEQDPLLSRVRRIAEPWDIGWDGYRLGQFPFTWMEWNDKFRDTTRAFWTHRARGRGELARRLTASADIFQHLHRSPCASVNYLAAHDGFTLADVVSYAKRHNHANGEDNRDGHQHNWSANFGHEGPTSDAHILALRNRVMRAMLATLLLAQGTPMLSAGDELGKTQQGNNNAYCQDNSLSWLDWQKADKDLMNFVSGLLALRRRLPILASPEWGTAPSFSGEHFTREWLTPLAVPMTHDDWHDTARHAFACLLKPGQHDQVTQILLLINGEDTEVIFSLPDGVWQLELDTTLAEPFVTQNSTAQQAVTAHGLLLLTSTPYYR